MVQAIIGRKIGMTQLFSEEDGSVTPVTAIEAGPCTVVQVKTLANDGYEAVQLGFGHKKRHNKPAQGHLKGTGTFAVLREVRVDDAAQYEVGQTIDVSIFEEGSKVDVVGRSRGMGFAGGVKRYHFAGGPKTHGQSDRHRAPGSVGAGTTPGRVFKGLHMAGPHGRRTEDDAESARDEGRAGAQSDHGPRRRPRHQHRPRHGPPSREDRKKSQQ